MSAEALRFSVVVPVYNEESAIGPLLEKLFSSLKNLAAEIIVVDDASSDKSPELLERYVREGKIKLVRHNLNRGYGAAIKSGLRAAGSDKILILDGDGSYSPENIPALIPVSGKAEMVIAARKSGFKIEPLTRRFFKWLVLKLLHYLAGIQVPDLNSGMRIFNKNIAAKYLSLLPDGFSFTSTLSLIFLSEGYPVEYVDIDYQPRQGKSKFRLRELNSLSLLVLRTIMYFNPLKFFIPLSVFLAALALFLALFSIFALGKFMDVTTVVILLSAMQIFILGLLADLLLRLRK